MISEDSGPDRLTGSEVAHAIDSSVISWRRGVGARQVPVACSSPIGSPLSPTVSVFCKSKSRFRNCSLPPTSTSRFRRNNVRLRLRPARRASSQLLNSDLITLFEERGGWPPTTRTLVEGEEELRKSKLVFGRDVENKKSSNYSLKCHRLARVKVRVNFVSRFPTFLNGEASNKVAFRNVSHLAIDFKN